MSELILASRSPARAALLANAGVRFQVRAGEVDERALKVAALVRGASPLQVACELASAKALAASRSGESLVLGADQTLDLEGRLFDKPPDLSTARDQLEELRGRTHSLHSALALAKEGHVVWSHVESATLTVRDFSDAFLESYIATEGETLLGCVGAYRLEGCGAQLFERVSGDYFTVLGLPLISLLAELRRRGLVAA